MTATGLANAIVEESYKNYVDLALQSERLKSEERKLNTALENLEEIKTLLIEKEKEFCLEDQSLRASACGRISVKDSLRKRCFNLIDHLIHYKCVIECLSDETVALESTLMDDDEYIRLCLIFRDAYQAILQAIKLNAERNGVFLNMHDEEAQSYLTEYENNWRLEHQGRRKLMSQLLLDQNQLVVDKTTKNLAKQQELLNQRYQSINNLIIMSYNRLDDNNNNNNDTKY